MDLFLELMLRIIVIIVLNFTLGHSCMILQFPLQVAEPQWCSFWQWVGIKDGFFWNIFLLMLLIHVQIIWWSSVIARVSWFFALCIWSGIFLTLFRDYANNQACINTTSLLLLGSVQSKQKNGGERRYRHTACCPHWSRGYNVFNTPNLTRSFHISSSNSGIHVRRPASCSLLPL